MLEKLERYKAAAIARLVKLKALNPIYYLLIIGLIVFLLVMPIAFIILALSFLINRKKEKREILAYMVVSLICAIALAWLSTELVIAFNNAFKKASDPVNILNWFSLNKGLVIIDKAGRIGAILGGIIGFILSIYAGRINKLKSDQSGPGLVRGEKIVKGGWATFDDIKDKFSFEYPSKGKDIGIPLGSMQNKLVSINPNKGKIKIAGHVLLIGATGTGKSFTYIRNQIIASAMAEHSIVITDPKGELFQDMALWLKEEGYNVIPFNVLEPTHSHWWNMLEECKDADEIIDLAEWLIGSAGDDHAFFTGGEKSALAAVMGYAKYVLPEEERHMRAVLSLLSWNPQILDSAFNENFKEGKIPQDIYEMWASCQLHYESYREGIRNKLRPITKGGLSALISRSDFSLDAVGREKTALFLILPAEDGDLQALLVPFYTFMFRRLDQLAATQKNGRLPIPTRFIMDEFANIGKVPNIDRVCALGRSKGIMIQIAIQNIGQLKGLYKLNNAWQSVVGNCPTKLCFSVDDYESAKFFTDMTAGAEIEHISESKDLRKVLEPRSRKMNTKTVPLLEPAELLQFPEDDSIAIVRGKKPLYIQKEPWINMPQYKDIVKAGQIMAKDYVEEKLLEISIPIIPSSLPINEDCNTDNENLNKYKDF